MYYLVLVSGLILGYLSGSVSYARIFSKLGKGVDITQIGNGNPGTSNVMREVGKFWGSLTLLGDALKGSLVMILYKWLFFSSAPVVAVDIPFGGSIGTLFGCWLFLLFPQFLINIVIAYIIVKIFFSKQKYPMGRMTPFVFLFTTPIYLLAESMLSSTWHPLLPGSVLFDHLGWGNHFIQYNGNGWMVVAGILLYGIAVIPTNLRLLKNNEILAEGE